jgi:transcription elongation factor Elf1
MRLRCPECGNRAVSRTSRQLSSTVTEGYYDCTNQECGCRFKALTEIVGLIVPGDIPNPTLSLPLLKRRTAKQEA